VVANNLDPLPAAARRRYATERSGGSRSWKRNDHNGEGVRAADWGSDPRTGHARRGLPPSPGSNPVSMSHPCPRWPGSPRCSVWISAWRSSAGTLGSATPSAATLHQRPTGPPMAAATAVLLARRKISRWSAEYTVAGAAVGTANAVAPEHPIRHRTPRGVRPLESGEPNMGANVLRLPGLTPTSRGESAEGASPPDYLRPSRHRICAWRSRGRRFNPAAPSSG
jgi:hypothetical protein